LTADGGLRRGWGIDDAWNSPGRHDAPGGRHPRGGEPARRGAPGGGAARHRGRGAESRPQPRGRAPSRVLSPLVPEPQARRPAARRPVRQPHAEHPPGSVGPAPGPRREAAAAPALTRDPVSGQNRRRACGARWIVRASCRGRRSRRGKACRSGGSGTIGVRRGDCSRRALTPESLPRRLLPAAARRWPLVPGGTLAVRPRPETRSRVDVKRGMAYGPRMSDDLAWLDASAQAELVRRGKASPAELVEAAIRRIERTNPELNAVIIPRFEKARAEAASRALPDGPFRGVPFLLKDLICYSAGDPHHMGTRFLRDLGFVAPADTYLAEKFRAAGFVFLGKTNTPELGTLPTTEPEAYGPS